MSILQEAHDFVITGGDFRIVQNNVSLGIDILHNASTPEAAVDAEERSYAPSCYPGTRNQYIDDITKWAAAWSSDNSQPIYWMKGPAGVGKSAIAQTCAAKLKDTGQLGAAFFFSINGRRKDHTRFFPTIAYQLSTICRDYREIINRKVSDDQTLVKKTMSAQYTSLIVDPLQELKEQGKALQRRTIFVDGLDECESRNAQMEIIRIIALSVRDGSTPFRWAIFSREEPHIASTFADPSISSHCYSVFLPISRETDEEIEVYLRGGFQNILQRRNLLSLSSSWPTAEDIRKLVDVAAGLFAHSATVLRFVDNYSYSGFEESLQAVIASIANPRTKAMSLYVELDRLYMLILERVPADVLPSMLLLLSEMCLYGSFGTNWFISPLCNRLGISKAVFQSIYHHLQAVLTVQDPPQLRIDKPIALERSYFDQVSTFRQSLSLDEQLWEVHGDVNFHHKSFHDFITDSNRSSTFCVTTPTAREQLFDRYIQQHFHYVSGYAIQGSKLVLAPGIVSSSNSLPWPQGSEFVDSYSKLRSLSMVSYALSHDDRRFGQFFQDVSLKSFQELTKLDYRKFLVAQNMENGLGRRVDGDVAGCAAAGTIRYTGDSIFACVGKDMYDIFDPAAFLRIVGKFENAGVIRPFDSRLGTSRAASILHTFSRQKPYGKSHGLYKMGHGDKSVIWYWEFDTGKQYFHQFQTVNFARAMAYYKAKKFKIWEWTDGDDVTNSDEDYKDDRGDRIGDRDNDEVRDNENDRTVSE